jgi:hypothetical protein
MNPSVSATPPRTRDTSRNSNTHAETVEPPLAWLGSQREQSLIADLMMETSAVPAEEKVGRGTADR